MRKSKPYNSRFLRLGRCKPMIHLSLATVAIWFRVMTMSLRSKLRKNCLM